MSDFSDRIGKLSPPRLALLALELQAQVDDLRREQSEPIAIIGMACRFPGRAADPSAFWQVLHEGGDEITEIPKERWDIDAFYDADPEAAGKMYARSGGFLEHIDRFDAQFFGIAPREAVSLDPQQRLLLEVSWEALESAALAPDSLEGSRTGVFVGISSSDYGYLNLSSGRPVDAHYGTGNSPSVAAGRLSYVLGLHGPCVAIDTACSSSLVAIHLACQSLRSREAQRAIAAGVNVILAPDTNVFLSRARMLAPDGRCKTFDAAADGYVRSEGCGVVVLARLSDALAAGDRILAVIRGSAVNQDGRSSGLTAPNGPSQEALVREALLKAALEPGAVDYVEAHGTGTSLGDPIEVQALGAVFGPGRSVAKPLLIGSVKTNIGHLEAAAGIAGLIKTVLALQHEELPAHLHFRAPNPQVAWDAWPISVVNKRRPWPRGERPRIAGVSSFGFSGTNAHVLIAEAPMARPALTAVAERPCHLLTLSAKTDGALCDLARRYADHLESTGEPLADLCFTANTGRAQFDCRLAIRGAATADVVADLSAAAEGTARPHARTGRANAVAGIALFFDGAASDWRSLWHALYESQPAFHAAFDHCATMVAPAVPRPLAAVLASSAPDAVVAAEYLGPAAFAVQYALAAMWRDWGVRPTAVSGCGVGEYVAACVGGIFSVEDAIRLTIARGRGELNRCAAEIAYRSASIDVVALAGGVAVGDALSTAAYWQQSRNGSFEAAAAMAALSATGCDLVVDVGACRVVAAGTMAAAASTANEGPAAVEPWARVLDTVAALYTRGARIDWAKFDQGHARRKVALPTYPFQRQRYWIGRSRQEKRGLNAPVSGHPLVGGRVRSPLVEQRTVLDATVNAADIPYLRDHRVQGAMLAPAALYLEIAMGSAHDVFGAEAVARVESFAVDEALIVADDSAVPVQIVLTPEGDARASFEILSLADGSGQRGDRWIRHASGSLVAGARAPAATAVLADVRVRCVDEIAGDAYYKALSARGFEMGPAFQAIATVRRGSNESLGEIRLPEALGHDEAGYIVHPVLFDACCHTAGAALQSTPESSYMVVGLESFETYGPVGVAVSAHATARIADPAAEMRLVDVQLIDEAGALVGAIDGLMFRQVTQQALARAASRSVAELLYRVAWESKPLAGSSEIVPALASIDSAAAVVMAEFAEKSALAALAEALPLINGLSTAYVSNALRELGWGPQRGECYAFSALRTRLHVADRHERLLRRMLEMLEQDGLIARRQDEWEIQAPLPVVDTAARARELSAAFPDAAGIVGLTSRCGTQLAAVLSGAADPVEVLFPGGSFDGLEQVYEHSAGSRLFNRLVQTAIQAVVARSSGRTLRILEIGAGTGGTTSSILPELPPDRARYVFTDLSPVFFDRAADKFANYPFVEYRRLDIERDPDGQGFANERFDVIVAANVLHATRDLGTTLDHVAKLLAPEGLLVLVEATGSSRWLDITFGLTEGWWRFEDVNLRPSHPLVTAQRWTELLSARGFIETSVLAPAPAEDATQAIVLGRGPRLRADASAAGDRPRTWIVLADDGGVGTQLADRLRTRGDVPVVVHADREGVFSNVLREAIDQAVRPDGNPLAGVIHLWSLDARDAAQTSLTGLDADQQRSCGSLMLTVQALLHHQVVAPVWTVTRRAMAAGGEHADLSVVQSCVWGFGRAVGLEHPELWGGLIDIDHADPARAAAAILSEIEMTDGEDQIALRAGERLVARLVQAPDTMLASAALKGDAAYVITGGLGALGLRIARRMAEQGARHLVLIGRRGITDPGQRAAVAEIEALGAAVHAIAADVTQRAELAAVFARFGGELPPLKGVIHAATRHDPCAAQELSVDRLAAMLQPKVTGTWVLHELTRELPLDFFVLFASTTGLLGSAMLSHYAAANAFLDTFAHYRRACGLPAIAIDWGAWDEMRTATDADRRRIEQGGLLSLQTPRALTALGQLMGAPDLAQITVANVDWSVLKAVYEAKRRRPFLERLGPRAGARPARVGDAKLIARLQAARQSERRKLLIEAVRSAAAGVLGARAADVDVDRGLFDLGMDSLMSVDLKRRLESTVGRPMPSTLAFNHPTVGALAAYIEKQLPELFAATSPDENRPPVHQDESDDADLSEGDLAALLADKLARVQ